MASKWAVNLAVRQSTMPPPRRLIMLVLSDVADPKTGIIPEDRTPCLRELAEWTGLDKSTVTRHLDALDDEGWVVRDRPERDAARREQVRTKYRLDVPRGAQDTTGRGADSNTEAAPEDDERGADNTTSVVHPAPTPVVQGAPVPYTDEFKNDKTSSSSAKPPKATTKRRPKPDPERPDIERICNHLADRVEANGSLRPTITAKWRTEARLLLDKDGRTTEQVIKAIDWCQNDHFWRANIKSMPKLRQQYDTLRLQAMRPNGRASPQRPEMVERNGMKLKPENAQRIDDRARFEAMDKAMAANANLAIGGAT